MTDCVTLGEGRLGSTEGENDVPFVRSPPAVGPPEPRPAGVEALIARGWEGR